MYLLDTNHCSRIIFGETNVIRRLQEHIGLGVATSVIVQGELLYMVQKSSQKQANLRFVKTFLQTIDLYPISGGVADVYGSLKGEIIEHFGPKDKAKRRKFTVQDLGFSDNDLWIASTALHYNLTVVSGPLRPSRFVPLPQSWTYPIMPISPIIAQNAIVVKT